MPQKEKPSIAVVCGGPSPETMLETIKDYDNHPVIAGVDNKGTLDKIKQMLGEREMFYRTADIIVESNNQTPPERIAEEIIDSLFEKQGSER